MPNVAMLPEFILNVIMSPKGNTVRNRYNCNRSTCLVFPGFCRKMHNLILSSTMGPFAIFISKVVFFYFLFCNFLCAIVQIVDAEGKLRAGANSIDY